jgi:hypothetical protein
VDETESTAGVSKVEAAQAVWYVRRYMCIGIEKC